jgi:hypothetical protein
MIRHTHKYPFLVLAVLLASGQILQAADAPPDFAKSGRPFLEKHCIGCHSGEKPKAELSLEPYRDTASVVKQRKVWDNALKMMVAGEMPQKRKDQPLPTVAESEAFIALVKTIFDYSDRNAKPDPGRVTMRRLNRLEYRNTIRDLVGVEFDPTEDFPSDDIGHGFDNIGDVLTLSPVLMERYLAAAENIMSRAITPNPPPVPKRHLSAIYTEPASADGAKVIEKNWRRMTTDGKEFIEVGPINTPYQWEADGEYIFRTRVFGQSGTDKPLNVTILVHGTNLPNPSADADLARLSGNVLKPARILKTFAVKGTKRDDAEVLEVRVPAMPNRHRMLIAIDKPAADQPPAKLYVEYLALEGPLDTRPPSMHRLLAATQGKPQGEQTREVMSRFLRRAFRRPPAADELQRSVKLVETAMAGGDKWEAGIQLAMQAALCSPKFLFRVETDDAPTSSAVKPLDEFQLATRLSYFLWSSMPDDKLLDLAEQKQLTGQLDAQVRRMLADPRASVLVRNFAMQWLQIKRIDFISPDGQLFPTFNEKLRASMLKETELFVESIFREDRSVLELIDADYTFLNEPLAKHYGIADTLGNPIGQRPKKPGGQPIVGEQFRRVALQDRTRGGLLTQASVLTVTSNPTRTSPVKRGRWVLEQILGAPPPPPPPNVPELSEKDKDVTAASLRQRMEVHRRNPACANCHAKMDPIGFALENFNAVGAFRTKDGSFDVDATGEFADGTKFTGPAELKAIVLQRKEEFSRCLTEKLLIYATGRGLEYYDRPTVERIVKALAAEDYKFSVLVGQIVQSDAFRKRRGVGASSSKND